MCWIGRALTAVLLKAELDQYFQPGPSVGAVFQLTPDANSNTNYYLLFWTLWVHLTAVVVYGCCWWAPPKQKNNSFEADTKWNAVDVNNNMWHRDTFSWKPWGYSYMWTLLLLQIIYSEVPSRKCFTNLYPFKILSTSSCFKGINCDLFAFIKPLVFPYDSVLNATLRVELVFLSNISFGMH